MSEYGYDRMSGGSAEDEWGYRPHLDGLRALGGVPRRGVPRGRRRCAAASSGSTCSSSSPATWSPILLRDLDGSGGRLRTLLRPAGAPPPAGGRRHLARHRGRVRRHRCTCRGRRRGRRDALRPRPLRVNWYFIRESADYFASDIRRARCCTSGRCRSRSSSTWSGRCCSAGSTRSGRGRAIFRRTVVHHRARRRPGVARHRTDHGAHRSQPGLSGDDTAAYQLLAGAFLALTPAVIEWVRRRAAIVRALPIAVGGPARRPRGSCYVGRGGRSHTG